MKKTNKLELLKKTGLAALEKEKEKTKKTLSKIDAPKKAKKVIIKKQEAPTKKNHPSSKRRRFQGYFSEKDLKKIKEAKLFFFQNTEISSINDNQIVQLALRSMQVNSSLKKIFIDILNEDERRASAVQEL